MNKLIQCIFLLAITMPFKGFGQQVCYPPPALDPFTAPIVECLDGYQWTLDPSIGGYFEPPGFCGDIDNPQWLAFVPTLPFMVITVNQGFCAYGNGIQLAAYDMNGPCTSTNLNLLQCYTPVGATAPPSLILSNLEIGKVHYLLIDGWAGDQCEYSIDVSPDLIYPDGPPSLAGPSSVIAGNTYSYELTSPIEEFIQENPCDNPFERCGCGIDTCNIPIQYIWTAPPGATVTPGTPATQASITFGDTGGLVCLEILSCASQKYCIDVVVIPQGISCDTLTQIPLGDSCVSAPLLCGLQLNGLCGNNANATADTPGNLQTISSCDITNNQYLRFIADDTQVSLILEADNCVLGNGLELSVFSTGNCNNFQSVVDCIPLSNGGLDTLTINGLTSCSEYYLMLDGQAGDICDYQIFIIDGISTEPLRLEEVSQGCIVGPTPLCIGDLATYSFTLPVCELVGGGNCGGSAGSFNFYTPMLADSCEADSVYYQWHVPAGMRIIGDSINVPSIQVMVVDTPGGYIYLSQEIIPSGDTCVGPKGCGGGGSCGTIKPLWVDIDFNIEDTTVVICEFECYDFCGNTICETPGVYTFRCPIPCGYRTLTLIVEPVNVIYDYAVLCDGDCYDIFGANYCQSGYYIIPINNCEEYHLELEVSPWIQAFTDQTDVSCNGAADGSIFVSISGGTGPFLCALGNGNFSSSPVFGGLPAGSYQVTIIDANGCQVNVNSTISEPSAISTTNTATDVTCFRGNDGSFSVTTSGGTAPYSYDIGLGNNSNTSYSGLNAGTYNLTITDNNGCTESIDIYIDEPAELLAISLSQETSCKGNNDGIISVSASGGTAPYSYSLGGSSLSSSSDFTGLAAGAYLIDIMDANGCVQSIIEEVKEAASIEENISQQICQGSSVNVGSNTYSSSGTYINTLTTSSGCDSIVTLDLIVTPQIQESLSQQICQGETVSVGSNTYNASGTYVSTLIANSGCDSIVTLDLIVTPQIQESLSQQICQGETVSVGSNTYNASGTYVSTFTANSGCDSIVTLDLIVTPQIQESLSQQICQGETVSVGSNTYNASGTYVNTLIANSGCDSIVTLDLIVTPQIQESLSQQICQGETVSVGSNTYNASGTYVNTLTASSGCDSIVTLDLIVTPQIQESFSQQVCQGEMVSVGSNTYNASGTYVNTLIANSGCDSIVTLDLIVTPQIQESLSQQICQGETVSVGSNTYNASGTYVNTLIANSGCDSIVTLDLIVTPQIQESFSQQICQGEMVSVGSNTYNASGTYVNTLIANSGCDSIVTLDLIVTPQIQESLSQQICQGETVSVGSNTYNASGTYVNTLIANSGCDSIVTLDLVVTPQIQESLSQQICQGETVSVGSNTYNASGTYVNTLIANSGCDSIVTLDLIVTPQIQESLSQQICQGETVSVGSNTYNASGTYVNTLTASSGCDSIVTLDLVVTSIDVFDQGELQLCQGECYTLLGQDYCQTGNYEVPFIGNDNCTDVYLFEITYYSSPGPTLGAVVTECDATNDYYTVSFDVIDGMPPFLVNGQLIPGGYFFSSLISKDSAYSFLLTDSDLCPLEIKVEGTHECIEVCETFAGEMDQNILHACETESINVLPPANSILEQDDIMEYILHTGNDIIIGDILARNTMGIFSYNPGIMAYGETYYISFVAGNPLTNTEVDLNSACTSIAKGQPIIFYASPIAEAIGGGILTCHQPEIELLTEAGALSGTMIYQWSTADGNILTDPTDLSIWVNTSGTYILSVIEYNSGCIDIDTVHVDGNSNPPTVSAGQDQIIELGDSLLIQANSNIVPINTRWFIDGQEISENELTLYQVPIISGIYTIQVEDESGCVAEDEVEVTVDRRPKVYLPNTFTPNNDNINDRFMIYTDASVNMVLSLKIFSRWGGLVYAQTNFPPNDPLYGWDGSHDNETLNNAVFIYHAEVELIDGSKKTYIGGITLIR